MSDVAKGPSRDLGMFLYGAVALALGAVLLADEVRFDRLAHRSVGVVGWFKDPDLIGRGKASITYDGRIYAEQVKTFWWLRLRAGQRVRVLALDASASSPLGKRCRLDSFWQRTVPVAAFSMLAGAALVASSGIAPARLRRAAGSGASPAQAPSTSSGNATGRRTG
jgi:hypothetical protein